MRSVWSAVMRRQEIADCELRIADCGLKSAIHNIPSSNHHFEIAAERRRFLTPPHRRASGAI